MANVSSVTLGTVGIPKMSARRRSCCALSRLALRKLSTRGGSCLSSCGMTVLLAEGLQSSTRLHDSGTSRGGYWHLRSCIDYGETGIALPTEMSFISPEEILQIIRIAVLRDQKCCRNRGVSIVVDEFAHKVR